MKAQRPRRLSRSVACYLYSLTIPRRRARRSPARGHLRRVHGARRRARGRSCILRRRSADGCEVTTIEGLARRGQLRAAARVRRGGRAPVRLLHARPVVSATALLGREPKPASERGARGDERQPLPLRCVPGHRARRAPRVGGASRARSWASLVKLQPTRLEGRLEDALGPRSSTRATRSETWPDEAGPQVVRLACAATRTGQVRAGGGGPRQRSTSNSSGRRTHWSCAAPGRAAAGVSGLDLDSAARATSRRPCGDRLQRAAERHGLRQSVDPHVVGVGRRHRPR